MSSRNNVSDRPTRTPSALTVRFDLPSTTPAPVGALEHRRVVARGTYVGAATLFLDNKLHAGTAGYEVLTPLKLESASLHVLVDRGWIAAGDRRRLPDVPTAKGVQVVEGV